MSVCFLPSRSKEFCVCVCVCVCVPTCMCACRQLYRAGEAVSRSSHSHCEHVGACTVISGRSVWEGWE